MLKVHPASWLPRAALRLSPQLVKNMAYNSSVSSQGSAPEKRNGSEGARTWSPITPVEVSPVCARVPSGPYRVRGMGAYRGAYRARQVRLSVLVQAVQGPVTVRGR